MADATRAASPRKRARRRQDFLGGKLLIAMPNMSDPRFEKSVLLMVSHDTDHAMGVMLNRPLAEVELADLLEQLSIDPAEGAGGEPVFYGGPVQTDRGLVVHTLDYRSADTMAINDRIGVTTSKDILVDIGGRGRTRTPPEKYLLAVGHAGWGGGQLEREISVNAWCHADTREDLIFCNERQDLWRRALKELGVTGAMLSPEWSVTRPNDAPLN